MRNLIICLFCSLIISGCGFSLRGNYELPASISQLRVGSSEAHSALERALRNELKPYSVEVIDSSVKSTSDTTSIYLLSDVLDRRLLSLFSTGQVAEYELIYTVRYELQFANSDAQLLEFGSDDWATGIDCLAGRFGKRIHDLSSLSDFKLFKLSPTEGRYVRGFAKAYQLTGAGFFGEELVHLRDGHGHRKREAVV